MGLIILQRNLKFETCLGFPDLIYPLFLTKDVEMFLLSVQCCVKSLCHLIILILIIVINNTAGIYLLKGNNRNTRTIKTPRRHWRRFGVFIVSFEHISHLCSSVSIVNFEHVIGKMIHSIITLFYYIMSHYQLCSYFILCIIFYYIIRLNYIIMLCYFIKQILRGLSMSIKIYSCYMSNIAMRKKNIANIWSSIQNNIQNSIHYSRKISSYCNRTWTELQYFTCNIVLSY